MITKGNSLGKLCPELRGLMELERQIMVSREKRVQNYTTAENDTLQKWNDNMDIRRELLHWSPAAIALWTKCLQVQE